MASSEGDEKCCVDGCKSLGRKRPWIEDLYCLNHYKAELQRRFLVEYEKFDEKHHERLAASLARCFEHETVAYSLTTAKIRDRTFNYIKTKDSLVFFIVRHLNAWRRDWAMKPMVTCYCVDIYSFKITEVASLFEDDDSYLAIECISNYCTNIENKYLSLVRSKGIGEIVKFYIYNLPLLKNIKSSRNKAMRAKNIKEFISKILLAVEGVAPFNYGHTIAMLKK